MRSQVSASKCCCPNASATGMPGIDTDYHLTNAETGVQVIAAVRRQLGTDVGTVLITGDTSSAVRALQHDERLRITSKPIDADELLSVLRELLAA